MAIMMKGAVLLLSLLQALIIPCCWSWSLPSSFPSSQRQQQQRPRQTKSLVDHLKEEGSLSKLDNGLSVVKLSENEFGVQYRGNTAGKQKEIVCIDRKEFVTPECGRGTAVGRALSRYVAEECHGTPESDLSTMYVSIFLSLVKTDTIDGGIQHQDYLNTLPTMQEMQHLPVFWNEQSVDELEGSSLQEAIYQRRSEWMKEYKTIYRSMEYCYSDAIGEEVLPFDFSTWCWARSIITSRGFTSINDNVCLVPYVDMVNHCSSSAASQNNVLKCKWEIEDDGFHLLMPEATHSSSNNSNGDSSGSNKSSKTIEISYGTNSNAAFLMNYGFAILDDERQTCEENARFSFLLDPDQQSNTDVETMWERDGLGACHSVCRNVTLSIGSAGPAESLLSLCRVASCQNDQELHRMQTNFESSAAGEQKTEAGIPTKSRVPQMAATLSRGPFSVSNEIRAMKACLQLSLKQLASYKTSIMEDNDLLSSSSSSTTTTAPNFRNAIIVRRGEKRVFQHFCNLACLCLDFLTTGDDIDFEEYKSLLKASLGDEDPLLAAEFAA